MYQISPLNRTMIFDNYSQGLTPSGEMGKQEFLQMLVAQLRHQDPLSPMESQQFASQLAEFSSLEELSNIEYAKAKPWTENQQLQFEKETLGFYFSGHPLTQYTEELKHIITSEIAKLNPRNESTVRVGQAAHRELRTQSDCRIDAGPNSVGRGGQGCSNCDSQVYNCQGRRIVGGRACQTDFG